MNIIDRDIKKQLNRIKKSPGVYIFRDAKNKVLYVGKAKNLQPRVRSYFIGFKDNRPLVPRIAVETKKIEIIETDSEVEAILLETKLIKRIKPPYNARQKDDKSFIYIFINFSDSVPRVQFVRQKEVLEGKIKQRQRDKLFGPFLSAIEMRKLLNYFRSIIPFRDCGETKYKKYKKLGRGCQWSELGKCSAPCNSKQIKEYRCNLSRLARLLSGKINRVKKELLREMRASSKNKNFEQAAEIRDRIETLDHIEQISMIDDYPNLVSSTYEVEMRRLVEVEGIDISNISGKYAVGSLVRAKIKSPARNASQSDAGGQKSKVKTTIQNSKVEFDKSGYRRFRIRIKNKPDDVAMVREVIRRRFNHPEWKFPDLLIIDGGRGQLNAVNQELKVMNRALPVVAIAKGPTRKGEKLFFNKNFEPKLKSTLNQDKRVVKLLRDEAHRFAIAYHKILRSKGILGE